MPTYRMLPPTDVGRQTLFRLGNGGGPRVLSAEPGEWLDCNLGDASALGANGWLLSMMVGPTASRPTGSDYAFGAVAGRLFLDTDLGKVIVFDGADWRDPVTGGAT